MPGLNKSMRTFEKRLASFNPTRKRRSSVTNSSTSNPLKWPHKTISPKQLALAGFYFNPTDENPDNTTCFLCGKSLTGWEPGDDPVVEHLSHSEECGWARIAAVVAQKDEGNYVDDPKGKLMRNARLATFGKAWWPHENKKGWLPNIDNMVDGGWHYCPQENSDDCVACAYCGYSIDFWEDDDDPLHSHFSRSSDCVFFAWRPVVKAPARRGPSAAMQPTKHNQREQSVAESVAGSIPDDEDTTSQRQKKAKTARGKKTAPGTAKKTGKKKAEIDTEMSFESEAVYAPEPAPRGRKRNSTAMGGPIVIWDGGKDTDDEDISKPPPPKRRATRASLAQQSSMADLEPVPTKTKAPEKRGGRRASSRTREYLQSAKKVSQTVVPDDDEIDRALALDLERPLTDEEQDLKNYAKPFIRSTKKPTRSRTSLAVEEKMKNAPNGILFPRASASTAKSQTPAEESEGEKVPTKTPRKFFREVDQDFSVPVKLPKHLVMDDEITPQGKVQKKIADEVERLIKVAEVVDEPEVFKKPAPKKGRGRKKKVDEESVAPEVEKPKAKRGRPKRAVVVRSRSNTADSMTAPPPPVKQPEIQLTLPTADQDEPLEEPAPASIMEEPAPASTTAEPAPAPTMEEPASAPIMEEPASAPTEEEEQEVEQFPPSPKKVDDGPMENIPATPVEETEPILGEEKVAEAETMGEEIVEEDVNDGTVEEQPVVEEADEEEPQEKLADEEMEEKAPVPMLQSPKGKTKLTAGTKDVGFTNQVFGISEQEQTPGSDTEVDEPLTPPRQLPISPSRRQVTFPELSTPKQSAKSGGLVTSKPWTSVDLDEVFMHEPDENGQGQEEDILTELEKGMTVAEWIKYNAEQAEKKLTDEAERIVGILENEGQRALEAIEGIETV